MKTRGYSFHGVTLAITGDNRILQALHSRLGQFRVLDALARPDLQFHFQPVPETSYPALQPPPGTGRPVLEFRAGQALYFEATHQLYLDFPGRVQALCDTLSGEVRIRYPESEAENLALLSHPCFTIPLAELLKRHGLFMVHAAGLRLATKVILVAGASGAGKTTLTIALLRAGFGFMGDDMVFLQRETPRTNRADEDENGGERPGPNKTVLPHGNGSPKLRVLAFPDEVDVTAQTMRFFPELGSTPLPPATAKQPLSAHQVFGAGTAWEGEPAVLVFPQVSQVKRSVLMPMPREVALVELMCNVLRAEPRWAQAHLDALAALVSACRCYRLRAGDDFAAQPALLRAALEETTI